MTAPAAAGPAATRGVPRAAWLLPLIVVLAWGQLAVAQWVPGIERFEGKAFGARLVAYPALMLIVPALWWLTVGRRTPDARRVAPYVGFALVALPFLVDVTGNTLDLYDAVSWWDDANHLVNWFLLSLGAGLLLARGGVRPVWALAVLVAGVGALLAVGWELAEYVTFIRNGTELDTAYTDTLGDEALGCLGAVLAAGLVGWRGRD